ncbi:MAG TPA: FAD-dependent oxidoreductase, partial [Methylomirabilota bacterium]
MTSAADIVIIGGGANGTSTAFHLASMGARSVRLLERRHLAAGATGKSGALVRMHYTNEHESRLALEGLRIFRDFGAIVGGECGFQAPGFLQLVPPGYEAALRRNLARQQHLGVDTREVSREEVRGIFPELRTDDVGAVAYEPGSGYADPNATAYAFAAAARRLGVTVDTGCEVTRILTERGRVTGVETARGPVQAPVVVLVPGAWGQPLLDPLGLDFGLQPFRIQVSLFRWPPALTRTHPVVIDA